MKSAPRVSAVIAALTLRSRTAQLELENGRLREQRDASRNLVAVLLDRLEEGDTGSGRPRAVSDRVATEDPHLVDGGYVLRPCCWRDYGTG